MSITRRAWLGGSIAATGWALGATGAKAQASTDFPAKDIKAICNFAPGTRADVMVRFFAERVGAALNRNVQVDNRVAENGNAGTKLAAKAKPDGYTIMITPGSYTLATAPAILKKPGFDPTRDFVPVTTLFKLNYAVLVDARSPAKTAADLAAALKAKGDKASYGYNSNVPLIAAEMFNKAAGADAAGTRYRDLQSIVNDLTLGNTDFIVMDVPVAAEQIKSGKLRALAVTGEKRSPTLAQVPTVAEAGLKGFQPVDQWWAVFAPAATPPAIVSRLEAVFNRVVGSDDTKMFLANGGAEPFPGNAVHLKELLAADIKRWRGLVEMAGIDPE
jgi:tripartite-type tricarboxylate transporter receptor subunit TctC